MPLHHRKISSPPGRVTGSWLRLGPLAAILFAAGCATPLRTISPAVSPDGLSDAAFIHYLAATPVVTVDEGARAVLLLVSDTANHSDADARRAALVERGLIRDRWDLADNSVLDRGTFAFFVCRALRVTRSFNEWLAARVGLGERRAALATAVYEDLLHYGPAWEAISGGEVADTLVRAERWQARRQAATPETP